MKSFKEFLNEMADYKSFSSGMYRSKKSQQLVKDLRAGSESVEIGNKSYAVDKAVLPVKELKAGMIVAASYNEGNQGMDVVEVKGFTDMDDKYGEGNVKFSSMKELLAKYDATNLADLEEKQEAIAKEKYGKDAYGHNSYMVAKEISSGDQGAWYYPYEGKWARGSGAEKLSFMLLKEVEKPAEEGK